MEVETLLQLLVPSVLVKQMGQRRALLRFLEVKERRGWILLSAQTFDELPCTQFLQ